MSTTVTHFTLKTETLSSITKANQQAYSTVLRKISKFKAGAYAYNLSNGEAVAGLPKAQASLHERVGICL